MIQQHPLKALALACLFTLPAAVLAQPETIQQKASYAIGIDIAKSFKKQAIVLDTNSVIDGIKDGLSGDKTALTQPEMTAALSEFKKQLMGTTAGNSD